MTFHSLFGDVPVRVRRLKSCPCQGASRQSFSTIFTNKNPVAPELSFLTAKLAALMPFGKAAAVLAELLPCASGTNAATVHNRTRRVGQRLEQQAQKDEKDDQALSSAPPAPAPAKEGVLGLDGAYVRSRHRRPEKNFEVIVGKALGEGGTAIRFAFPTNHPGAEALIRRALRRQGIDETTPLTVFSDGEAGLRELQRRVAPNATHILDWFHVAMRFEHLLNLAQGQPPPEPSALADMRAWSLDLIDRAKWALWNGQSWKTQAYLEDLCGWCHARRPETPRVLLQLGKAAQDLWGYLETNRDSLPNYGKRYRAGLPISTAFTESAVNEIVAKRMNKSQQMRWNRYTARAVLDGPGSCT